MSVGKLWLSAVKMCHPTMTKIRSETYIFYFVFDIFNIFCCSTSADMPTYPNSGTTSFGEQITYEKGYPVSHRENVLLIDVSYVKAILINTTTNNVL